MTETVRTVTMSLKLSTTYFVSNIRHQHRCSRIVLLMFLCSTNLSSSRFSYPSIISICQSGINPPSRLSLVLSYFICALFHSRVACQTIFYYFIKSTWPQKTTDHFSFSLFRKKMENLDETKIAAIPTLGDSVAFTTLGLYKIDMFLREHMVV